DVLRPAQLGSERELILPHRRGIGGRPAYRPDVRRHLSDGSVDEEPQDRRVPAPHAQVHGDLSALEDVPLPAGAGTDRQSAALPSSVIQMSWGLRLPSGGPL